MTVNGWIQIAIFVAILIALARPLGGYMTVAFTLMGLILGAWR